MPRDPDHLRRRGHLTTRHLLAVVQLLVLSGLAYLLVQGDGPGSRDVILVFSRDHGLNRGDLPVVVVWLLGVLVTVTTWRRMR